MSIGDKYASLPVAAVAGEVNAVLAAGDPIVVTAPPGAGKSTLLPLTMLEALPEGKIVMLEPRRLAARQVAVRMAGMLGEQVGGTVGYRVRFDTKVSSGTRIEVVTEGIMERMLVEDPTLDGVAAVIFDEFHERSLSSDLSLALTLAARDLIRPDLGLVLMSATVDASAICSALSARHIHSEGKMYEVETVYCGDSDPRDCVENVAACVRRAFREQDGDILAFLPGQGEILRCADKLRAALPAGTVILPLYGMMSPDDQHRVLSTSGETGRRVVLATPIAETSLTIGGITAVVDSGLCRRLRFDPSSGLSRLVTVGISRDMAAQRAGRAGRLAPGKCYRLWSKAAEHRMKDCREPEILSADLTPMVLGIAAWGESDPMRLPWLTPPPAGHVAAGRELLTELHAVDSRGAITDAGRRLAALPCNPRIARMLTEAGECMSERVAGGDGRGGRMKSLACDIAALLEERDPVDDETDADITTRIEMLRRIRRGRPSGRWNRIIDIAAQYRRLIGCQADNSPVVPEDAGALIALAYPERVAMSAGGERYRVAGGEYVSLHPDDALSRHRFLAVASMEKRIFLAASVGRETMDRIGFWLENVGWDSRSLRVVAQRELRVGSLVIDSRPVDVSGRQDEIVGAIAQAALKEGLSMFDFNDDVQRMQTRIATVALWHPEMQLPSVDTESMLATVAEWLPLYIGKAMSAQELRKIDLCRVIWGMLDYQTQIDVDRIAPTHLKLPCGRNVRIDYRKGAESPVVSARLQDCFGLLATPRLDGGTRPVLMELLSPGFKPVQLTQDMEGFWRTTYFDVRKELRRRYPKHRWPDDPYNPTAVK